MEPTFWVKLNEAFNTFSIGLLWCILKLGNIGLVFQYRENCMESQMERIVALYSKSQTQVVFTLSCVNVSILSINSVRQSENFVPLAKFSLE